jgi:hypothetical protein
LPGCYAIATFSPPRTELSSAALPPLNTSDTHHTHTTACALNAHRLVSQ